MNDPIRKRTSADKLGDALRTLGRYVDDRNADLMSPVTRADLAEIARDLVDVRTDLLASSTLLLDAALDTHPAMLAALVEAACERARQVAHEGFTPEQDDNYRPGELAIAACCYLMPPNRLIRFDGGPKDTIPTMWPWPPEWWKPNPDDRIREVVKGLALGLAEFERLMRVDESVAPR